MHDYKNDELVKEISDTPGKNNLRKKLYNR